MSQADETIEALFTRVKNVRASDKKLFESLISSGLRKVNFIDFLVYNFRNLSSPTYTDYLMLGTKTYWTPFSLNQWKELIIKLQDHKLGLHCYLGFLYKYIGIDSIALLKETVSDDYAQKEELVQYVEDNKNAFSIFDRVHLLILGDFDLVPSDFDPIREALIHQGAKKATRIEAKVRRLDFRDLEDSDDEYVSSPDLDVR